jgi:diguanylate cyclase (GGDEF)-like protein
LNDNLRHANRQLEALSVTDELTKLFNRRFLNKKLDDEFRRATRYSHFLSCLMMDADHFKTVNDTYGHSFGDVVLKEIAAILFETAREVDICGRFGGEEFIALLPNTDIEKAFIVADRLRKKIEEHNFVHEGTTINRTVSIGISALPEELIKDEFQLVEWADIAMYAAKTQGRNRVIKYSDTEEYKKLKP